MMPAQPQPAAARRRWPFRVALALAIVIAVVAVALVILDAVLLRRVRAETAQLSSQLGRPVDVGGISTHVFPHVGVRVTEVRVGSGPGEGLPMLEVPRAEVKVALFRTLLGFGKRVAIYSLSIDGPRLNVVRLPDGTMNIERLQRALAQRQPHPPTQPAGGGTTRRVALEVERAALENGRIALVDRSRPGGSELTIDQLAVTMRDLAPGRPLDVIVQAAVLAAARNFDLRVHAAPLPPTLVPTVEHLTLKVTPIDLTPLARFVPRDVAFEGGRLQANLDAALGAAVEGGKGPTRIQGGMRADAVRFRGQPPGRTLDALLDADLQGDADRGDVRIGRLLVKIGPAEITGRGSATGLGTGSPRVEGLEIASRGLDPAAIAELVPPLRRALGGRIAGPIGLSIRGAGTPPSQGIEMAVDLTPVRLAFPDELSKAAGALAKLDGILRSGAPGGALAMDLHADLSGVDLRPGGSLNKAPGDRLALAANVKFSRTPRETHIDLGHGELGVLADTITGTGTADLAKAAGPASRRFTVDLKTARLDLDRLLLPSKKPAKPPDPATFAGLAGRVTARADTVRIKKADLKNVVLDLRIDGDKVVVERADASAFGGALSAAGTQVQLAHPRQPMRVAAELRGIELRDALASFVPAPVVSGNLQAKLDLTGDSRTSADLKKTLSGVIAGDLKNGVFVGKDVIASVTGPLSKALPFGGLKAAAAGGGGGTSLGPDVPFSIQFANGTGRLDKPIVVKAPQAEVQLGGSFRLDGTADLPCKVSLAPQTIATLTGGRARPAEPIPVSLRLVGPAWSPSVADLGLQPAVTAIAKQAGVSAVTGALGIQGAPASPDEAKKQAEQRSREAAERTKKKAQEEAEKRLKGLFGR